MKRLISRLTLAIAAAFALAAAAPAFADDCGDCKNCPKHKASAAGEKAGAAEKTGKKSAKPAGKESAKPAENAPAPAPAPATGDKKAQAPEKCACEKGGKGCVCKKGECKCANCGQAAPKAA